MLTEQGSAKVARARPLLGHKGSLLGRGASYVITVVLVIRRVSQHRIKRTRQAGAYLASPFFRQRARAAFRASLVRSSGVKFFRLFCPPFRPSRTAAGSFLSSAIAFPLCTAECSGAMVLSAIDYVHSAVHNGTGHNYSALRRKGES